MVRDNIVNQNLCEFCKDEKSQEHRNKSSYNTFRQMKIREFLKESYGLKLIKNKWRKKDR
jgi:cytidine deaminase